MFLVPAIYVVLVIGMSVMMAWIFVNTGGSVLMTLLLHTSLNTAAIAVPMLLKLSDSQPVVLLYFLMVIPIALLLLLTPAGRRSLTASRAD